MRETSCCLCQTIIKLILLKLLNPPPNIEITYLILIILILNEWYVRYILLDFSLKANSSDTDVPFLDLNLSITNGKGPS